MSGQVEGKYSRRVSSFERMFVAMDQLRPGVRVQFVIEGEGALSQEQLQAAVARAAEANPGCRLILRGALGWMRWVALGPVPPTRVVDNWTTDELPSPEIERPLSPEHGPTCEFVLAPSPRPRIVVRCFHGIMDAGGLLYFAEEVFRALRGEPLVGSPCTLNDAELVRSLVGNRTRPPARSDSLPVTGAPSPRARNVIWQRFSFNGPASALIAKASAALARHARQYHTKPTKIMVPIDLRNYKKELRTTGNMSGVLFFDLGGEESWQEIHKKLLKGLISQDALRIDPAEDIVPWIPVWLLRDMISRMSTGWHRGRLPFSALVSHITPQSSTLFSGGGFHCRSLYPLPSQNDFLPLVVSMVTTGDATEVVVSAPSALVDGGRLAQLCDAIRSSVTAR